MGEQSADQLALSSELSAQPAEHVVVYLPKSRARIEMLVELAAACLPEDGKLWLVGAKKAGIASAGKALKNHFSRVSKRDAARHCMLFEGQGKIHSKPFDKDHYWQHYAAGDLQLFSLPGVFSHGQLDDASALLLQALPPQMPGACLDFGCGCGVLSAAAAQRGASVSAMDVDLLAVRSCQRTLAENQLTGQVCGASRIAPGAGPYRWIISNPPFHQGIRQDLSVAVQMFSDGAKALSPDGELWLVANRFLDYPRPLAALFKDVTEMAGNGSFRVIRARGKK